MIAPAMNNHRLGSLIQEHADQIYDNTPGYWKFEFKDRALVVMTDEAHNRMRIITPVAEVTELADEIWLMCMSANFDRALDARYAVSGDYLWSAFIHPLQQLDDGQFVDAIEQVATLAENFGTSFSSSDLVFGS
jgi:hypothetical protein